MDYRGGKLFLKYSLARPTVWRALKVALFVGPVLTLINQAHRIVALDFDLRFVVQTALTFCVPYLVSTYSSAMTEVANARQAEVSAPGAPPGGES